MTANYEKFMNHEFGRKANKTFQQYLDFICAILLGATGVGKSTIANALMGINLKVIQDKYSELLLTAENQRFKIGTDMKSTTTIPNIQVDEMNKLIICDPPGFFDNRTAEQDAINSFVIDQLFNAPNKIRILLVISEQEMSCWSARGKTVMANFERLTQMFPNQNELKRNIGLVITGGDGRHPQYYLQKLLDGNPSEAIVDWGNYFLHHMDENVFSFPKATASQIGMNYSFADRERLMRFLHTSTMSQPCHKVILSDEAKLYISEVEKNFDSIEEIVHKLLIKCRKEFRYKGLEEFKKWNQAYSSIIQQINDSIRTPNDFAELFDRYLIHSKPIDKKIKKIRKFHQFFLFISHIENYGQVEGSSFITVEQLFQGEKRFVELQIQAKQNQIQEYQLNQECQKKSNEILGVKKQITDLKTRLDQMNEQNEEYQIEFARLTRLNELEMAKYNELKSLENRNLQLQQQIEQAQNQLEEQKREHERRLERVRREKEAQIQDLLNKKAQLEEYLRNKKIDNWLGPLKPVRWLISWIRK